MINILTMVSECSSPVLSLFLRSMKNILTLIQIIVPILLMMSLVMNLINLMQNPDDKKLKSKINNSAISAIIIFFIPVLINVLMNLLGEQFSVSLCWNNIGEYNGVNKYISINNEKKKNMYTNPDDYEKGVPKQTDSDGGTDLGENVDGTAKQVGDVVWDPNDLTRISNLTSNQLVAVLNAHGGKAKNFIPYASRLITTEQKYQVNVFFLIGVEALESGWITSSISRNCNNLGGVCASSKHPSNGCGSNSNCSFAYFKSVNEFVDYHGEMLHRNYLTPGGAYYHGKTLSGVVQSYCPGCSSWPSNVTSIANSLFKQVSKVI